MKKYILIVSLIGLTSNFNLLASESSEDDSERQLIVNSNVSRQSNYSNIHNVTFSGISTLLTGFLSTSCFPRAEETPEEMSNEEAEEFLQTFDCEDRLSDIRHSQALSLSRKNLFDKNLSEPLVGIGKFTFLRRLFLSGNGLESLPDSIGNLIHLRDLEAYSNKIKYIPDSFGDLIHLKVLDLSHNAIVSIPDRIGNLSSLEELNMDNNAIMYISDSIGNLIHLKNLYLNYNLIESIPDTIGNLRSLENLLLSNNILKTFPESLVKLPTIRVIAFDENPLQTIPDFFGSFRTLHAVGCAFSNRYGLVEQIAFKNFVSFYNPKAIVLGGGIEEEKLTEYFYHLFRFLSPNYRELVQVINTLPLSIAAEIIPAFISTDNVDKWLVSRMDDMMKKYYRPRPHVSKNYVDGRDVSEAFQQILINSQ